MCDELVQVALFVPELGLCFVLAWGGGMEGGGGHKGGGETNPRDSVPALFPCPEFGFVEGVVFCADYDKVE